MHQGNIDWLRDLDRRFRSELARARVLELGSLSVNGSARDHLHVAEWVGVDKERGPGVDIVEYARHTWFGRRPRFDVLVCLSMLEHDPDWRSSLSWNLGWLKLGGLVFLSWGAEGNQHHEPEPWAPVPVRDVEIWIDDQGLAIIDSYWEASLYTPDCAGCYNMVLLHNDGGYDG